MDLRVDLGAGGSTSGYTPPGPHPRPTADHPNDPAKHPIPTQPGSQTRPYQTLQDPARSYQILPESASPYQLPKPTKLET